MLKQQKARKYSSKPIFQVKSQRQVLKKLATELSALQRNKT